MADKRGAYPLVSGDSPIDPVVLRFNLLLVLVEPGDAFQLGKMQRHIQSSGRVAIEIEDLLPPRLFKVEFSRPGLLCIIECRGFGDRHWLVVNAIDTIAF